MIPFLWNGFAPNGFDNYSVELHHVKGIRKDFYKGVSNPVNKKLFDIFKTCGFGEESGHGVPTVVSIYGEKAYRFSESYINVIIPFDKSGFDNDDVDVEHPRNIQETSKKKYMS